MVKPGIYQHYKGKQYKVIMVVTHSETMEELVIYQQMYDTFAFWARPVKMFNEEVEFNGEMVKRFFFLKEN